MPSFVVLFQTRKLFAKLPAMHGVSQWHGSISDTSSGALDGLAAVTSYDCAWKNRTLNSALDLDIGFRWERIAFPDCVVSRRDEFDLAGGALLEYYHPPLVDIVCVGRTAVHHCLCCVDIDFAALELLIPPTP